MRLPNLLFRVKVSGESCWPHLIPGKKYFATSVARKRAGDFIVFRQDSGQRIYVKRIREVLPAGFRVESTLSWGEGSAELGVIKKRQVLGRILNI